MSFGTEPRGKLWLHFPFLFNFLFFLKLFFPLLFYLHNFLHTCPELFPSTLLWKTFCGVPCLQKAPLDTLFCSPVLDPLFPNLMLFSSSVFWSAFFCSAFTLSQSFGWVWNNRLKIIFPQNAKPSIQCQSWKAQYHPRLIPVPDAYFFFLEACRIPSLTLVF